MGAGPSAASVRPELRPETPGACAGPGPRWRRGRDAASSRQRPEGPVSKPRGEHGLDGEGPSPQPGPPAPGQGSNPRKDGHRSITRECPAAQGHPLGHSLGGWGAQGRLGGGLGPCRLCVRCSPAPHGSHVGPSSAARFSVSLGSWLLVAEIPFLPGRAPTSSPRPRGAILGVMRGPSGPGTPRAARPAVAPSWVGGGRPAPPPGARSHAWRMSGCGDPRGPAECGPACLPVCMPSHTRGSCFSLYSRWF